MANGGTATLSIVVQARDEASRVMQQVVNQMRAVGTSLQTVMAAARSATAVMQGAFNNQFFGQWFDNLAAKMSKFSAGLRGVGSGIKQFFADIAGGTRQGVTEALSHFEKAEGQAKQTSGAFGVLGADIIVLNQAWELLNKTLALAKSAWDNTIGALIHDAVEIDALAKSLELTNAEVQDLKVIAEATSTSVTSLATATQRLTKSVGEAGNTSSVSFRILHDALKFTTDEIKALNQASSLDRFKTVLERFREFAPSATRAAEMARLFGLNVREVNKVMADWDAAEQALQRDRERGLRLNDQEIAGAKGIADAWAEFVRTLGEIRNQIGAQPALLDAVMKLINALTEAAVALFRALSQTFGPTISQQINTIASAMQTFAAAMASAEGREAIFKKAADALNVLFGVFQGLAAFFTSGGGIVLLAALGGLLGLSFGGPLVALGGVALGAGAGAALEFKVKEFKKQVDDFIATADVFGKKAEEVRQKIDQSRQQGFIPGATAETPPIRASFAPEDAANVSKAGDAYKATRGEIENTLVSQEALNKAIEKANAAWTELNSTLGRYWEKQKAGTVTTKDVEFALKSLHEAQSALNAAAEKGDKTAAARLEFVKQQIEIFGAYRDQVKEVEVEQKKQAAAEEKYAEGVEKLQGKVVGATDALAKYRQAILDAAKAGQDWNRLSEEQKANLISLAEQAQHNTAIQSATDSIQKLWDAWGSGTLTVRAVLEAFKDLYSKGLVPLRAEAEKGDQAAKDLLAGYQAQQEALVNLAKTQEEAKKSQAAYFDLFGAISDGFGKVIDGLVSGTQTIGGAFQALKTSIIGSFVQAFAAGLKEKLGFEGAFKINIVSLGKELLGLVGGIFTGSGPSGSGTGGLISSLVGKVGGYLGFPTSAQGVAGSLLKGGGAGASTGTGFAPPLTGAASYLGGGAVPGLLLGAGTYAAMSGQKGYGALMTGAAGAGYGAQALFASGYGTQAANYLAGNFPQAYNLATLFGARSSLPVQGAAAFGGGGGFTGVDVSTGAGFSGGGGIGGGAGGAAQGIGTIAGSIAVVTGLASAALGVYSAIKAETSYGKATGAISAAAGVSAAVAAGAAMGLLGAAAAASIIPVVGWIVAAVLAIVAALMIAFQPPPNFQAMMRESTAKVLDKVLNAPGTFEAGGTHKLTPAREAEFAKYTGPQQLMLQVAGREVANAMRQTYGSVSYEHAMDWVWAILKEGTTKLTLAGRDVDKIIEKLLTTFGNLTTAIGALNVIAFEKGSDVMKTTVKKEDYIGAIAGFMTLFSEEFPAAMDASKIAMEVVAEFAIATVTRLKRKAIQDVAEASIVSGRPEMGDVEFGYLRDEKKAKKLGQGTPEQKAKRQAAAEAVETQISEVFEGIKRAIEAVDLAGAGAPLRLAVTDMNVARGALTELSHMGAKVFADELPKAMDAAIKAVEAWAQALGDMINNLRALREQIMKGIRQFWSEQDALRQSAATGDATRYGRAVAMAPGVKPVGTGPKEKISWEDADKWAADVNKLVTSAVPLPSEQTATRYAQWIRDQQTIIDKSASAAAQVTNITAMMDLLREQAQAEIQDIQDRLARTNAVLQGMIDAYNEQINVEQKAIDTNNDRIEALAKESEILQAQIDAYGALAGMVEGLKDAINATKLAGRAGIGRVEELQTQTVDAMQEFSKASGEFATAQKAYAEANDDNRTKLGRALASSAADRANAAQRALTLSQSALQQAGETFGVGSPEYMTVQRQTLRYQEELLKAAKDAKEAQDKLQAEEDAKQDERDKLQRDNEAHQKNIEEYNRLISALQAKQAENARLAQVAIDAVNKRLADTLNVWYPRLLAAQATAYREMNQSLLDQGLTQEQIDKALADPQYANLLIQKMQLDVLEGIKTGIKALVNATLGHPGSTADVPGMATGGTLIANRPTLFLAGERGREKVTVTPLPAKEAQQQPINITVSFNLNGSATGSSDATRFARTAADQFEAEMRARLPRILTKRVA